MDPNHRRAPRRSSLDKPAAFARIFRDNTFTAVRRWLERLGVPARDRDDLVQDVLIAAYRSFPSYDPERAAPERWLNRIAVHLAAHYRESARHRLEGPAPEDAGLNLADGQPGPEEQLAALDARRIAAQMLAALDAELRSVLIAHDVEEIPMAEIAASQGVPLSTMYKRRSRAIAALAAAAAQRRREEQVR